jgi:3-dehydroquinate synthase
LIKVRLKLKSRGYDIFIGPGLLDRAGAMVKKVVAGKSAMIVSNKKVFSLHGGRLKKSLSKYFSTSVCLLPDGEQFKNIDTLKKIYSGAALSRLDRGSCIVALGGGVIGDMAGFAAATYMRGIKVAQVPTTLLAMTDSSIGGKTGVDTPGGKNMVGAFHQPSMVIMDTSTLKTLEESEFKNGLAEVIKHGVIMDPVLFEFIKANRENILSRDPGTIQELVARSAGDKAKIVSRDEKETKGIREILNYGHTIGHAIEAEGSYRAYRHGECVILGMVASARIAYDMGICSKDTLLEQIKVFNSFNLIKPLKNLRTGNILKRLLSDKKVKNGKIRFILTKEIGHVKLIENVPFSIIKKEVIGLL